MWVSVWSISMSSCSAQSSSSPTICSFETFLVFCFQDFFRLVAISVLILFAKSICRTHWPAACANTANYGKTRASRITFAQSFGLLLQASSHVTFPQRSGMWKDIKPSNSRMQSLMSLWQFTSSGNCKYFRFASPISWLNSVIASNSHPATFVGLLNSFPCRGFGIGWRYFWGCMNLTCSCKSLNFVTRTRICRLWLSSMLVIVCNKFLFCAIVSWWDRAAPAMFLKMAFVWNHICKKHVFVWAFRSVSSLTWDFGSIWGWPFYLGLLRFHSEVSRH